MKNWNHVLLSIVLCISFGTQAADLSTLYNEMIRSFPGLVASKAQFDAGKFRAIQAQGNLLPKINISSSVNRTRFQGINSLDYYNGRRYNLNITQSLFNREKTEDKKSFDALASQNYEDYLAFKSTASVDLVDRYVQVLAAEDRVTQVIEEKKLVARQLEQLRTMYKLQLSILTDVLEVEARLDNLSAQEIGAVNDADIARESLAELVGRNVLEPLDRFAENLSFAENDENTKQYWTDLGLANNNTLSALNNKITSAKADVKKAAAGHLPTVSLQLNAQKSNIGSENRPSQNNKSYVASLNFSIPLYSGGSTTARESEKKSELIEARARYEESRRTIIKDIRQAFLNVSANKATLKASKKKILSAKKIYQAMSRGLEYGTVTVVDVLDAQKDVLQYRNEYSQNKYDYVVNWLNLLRLSGQFNEKSITQANTWLTKN